MSPRAPVEAHGHLYPVPPDSPELLRTVLADWGLGSEEVVIEHEGDLLRFSVHGVCFPLDDVEEALTPLLTPGGAGKIDLIDREGWTLTRLMVHNGAFVRTVRNLNDVLHFSGF